MISVENIWSFDNGVNGIVDFTVVAKDGEASSVRRIRARAVETGRGEVKFVGRDKLARFLGEYSDDQKASLEWLRRMLSWHLDYQRSPAFAPGG